MSYLPLIRDAHEASGATVTELAESTAPKMGRARLGYWLSRAKLGAKPREAVYNEPSADDARIVLTAALALAKGNVAKLEELSAQLPPE